MLANVIETTDRNTLFKYFLQKPNPDKNGKLKQEKWFLQYFPEIYKDYKKTVFEKEADNMKFSQKLWHFLQYDEQLCLGRCKECGKRTSFISFASGYLTFCSNECSNKNNETKDAIKNTLIQKYNGVGFASQQIANKFKKTMTDKYGCEYSAHSNEIKEKIKKVNLEKYGGTGFASDITKKLFIKTMNKKYGVNYSWESEKLRSKTYETNKERYGNPHYTNKEKGIQTHYNKIIKNSKDILKIEQDYYVCKCTEPTCEKCVEKTFKISKQLYYMRSINGDVTCVKLNNPKSKNTSKDEKLVYDLVCELYKGDVQRNNRKELNKKEIDIYLPELKKGIEFNGDYWHNNPITMFDAERMGVWERDEQKEFLANQNGIEILRIWENEMLDIEYVKYKLSKFINSTTPKASAYYKLKTFLNGLQIQYVESVFGEFEYNDVIVKYVNAFYHNNLTDKKSLFLNSEKRVIYAYNYEVNDDRKFEVLQSQIKHSLGLTKTKIYARNCELREITNKEAKPFLEENSLYGYRSASITIGLYNNGELIMVYSFGHNYYGRKGALEVIRVCTLKNAVVVGGSSKCLSYFLKKYAHEYKGNKLVFYVDKIHQDGKSLKGFNFVHHYNGVMNYWLKENFGGAFYGEVGTAFSRNPSKNKEIAKLEKDGYIVSVPTVGVDVYEMEL